MFIKVYTAKMYKYAKPTNLNTDLEITFVNRHTFSANEFEIKTIADSYGKLFACHQRIYQFMT